jgi:beta-galactosidase
MQQQRRNLMERFRRTAPFLRGILAGIIFVAGVSQTGFAGLWVYGQSPARPSPLTVVGSGFELNGKPIQLISGEMEYARIPRADWRDRLRKARAMGLNAVTVYVFWNLHEPRPGVYDFSGQNDVAEYLREAQQEGLYVILRPGPYVCAEWDLGGYPAWLLKDHSMKLRSMQPQFVEAAARWLDRLGQELAPLQASRGGPILAVQVENEYGSFGDDPVYVEQIRRLVLHAGFTGSLLYTADGADVLSRGSLPGTLAAIDFGTGDAARSVGLLKAFRPGTPVWVAEYWDGWFDHWGEKHHTVDAAAQEAEIRRLLSQGASISLYMEHGGTTFGWMNGANNDHNGYQPDVSSYDYDAPQDESGRPRPKYFRLRAIIAEETHTTPPPVPQSAPLINLPPIRLEQSLSLWTALPQPISSPEPLSMEDVDQGSGYILYRTRIRGSGSGILSFQQLHSYARVYLDSRLAGTLDRRLGQSSLPITVSGEQQLDVLVENSGRINFTPAIRSERAGILGEATFAGVPLTGWKIYSLPFTPPPDRGYRTQSCIGPCLYRAAFFVDRPGDTFLNTQRLSKGVVWVNGHLLGRFWDIGPMGSLFLPGAWLQTGPNRITVLDLDGGSNLSLAGQDHPTIFDPQPERSHDGGE